MRHFNNERKQYGIRVALRRQFGREALPLLGYLILACGTAFAIQQEHTHAGEQRAANVAQTYKVLVASCRSTNELRREINKRSDVVNKVVNNIDQLFFIVGNVPPTRKLTPAEQAQADKFKKILLAVPSHNAKLLHDYQQPQQRDCVKAFAALKPKR